jgi:hypothetical protein
MLERSRSAADDIDACATETDPTLVHLDGAFAPPSE